MQQRGEKEFKTFLEGVYGSNLVHPLAGLIFAIGLIWTFCAPRRYLLWPIIMIACFISPAQRFAIMGLDFHFLRAIAVIMIVRILVFRDLRHVRIGLPDWLLMGMISTIILCTLVRGGGSAALLRVG